jgi:hypothetical protein
MTRVEVGIALFPKFVIVVNRNNKIVPNRYIHVIYPKVELAVNPYRQ